MKTADNINWEFIGKAIKHYTMRGFKYVDVPWVVDNESISITMPNGRSALQTQDGFLVGSAEQSFIFLALSKKLNPGRYVTCSPCFRDEEPDALHQKQFMKVELIELSNNPIRPGAVESMVDEALLFFRSLPMCHTAKRVVTSDGFDIELNNVEIGSYGQRSYRDLHWVYGTGIAEPRLSTVSRAGNVWNWTR
jgi:seryl-tRNA synthetase